MSDIARAMRRIFDETTLAEMQSLWRSGLYSQASLAEKYHCSITTICLWVAPPEKRAQKLKSRVNRILCDCGATYETHEKCRICKIHTHTKDRTSQLPNFYKFGLKTKHPDLCDDCYEAHKEKFLSLRGCHRIGPVIEDYFVIINPYTKEVKII